MTPIEKFEKIKSLKAKIDFREELKQDLDSGKRKVCLCWGGGNFNCEKSDLSTEMQGIVDKCRAHFRELIDESTLKPKRQLDELINR